MYTHFSYCYYSLYCCNVHNLQAELCFKSIIVLFTRSSSTCVNCNCVFKNLYEFFNIFYSLKNPKIFDELPKYKIHNKQGCEWIQEYIGPLD